MDSTFQIACGYCKLHVFSLFSQLHCIFMQLTFFHSLPKQRVDSGSLARSQKSPQHVERLPLMNNVDVIITRVNMAFLMAAI